MFHSVSGRQRRVHAFERFCGSNLSSKYAKLNTAVACVCKRCRVRGLGPCYLGEPPGSILLRDPYMTAPIASQIPAMVFASTAALQSA